MSNGYVTLEVDLTIRAGSDFDDYWEWAVDDTPVDLTGCTARMQLREMHDSDVVVAELTTENGGITIDGTAGRWDFFLSSAATSLLSGRGVYDMELVYGDGRTHRIMAGFYTISPEATR